LMVYEMSNSQILSPKASIDESLVFLGMSSMEKTMGIQALLRISEYDCLPLFFDERLICVPTSIKYGDQFDEEGKFVESLLIDPDDEREFLSGHLLDSFQLYKSSENAFEIIVRQVIHDGRKYYISQSDGTISEGVSIGYKKFYLDREQLIKFKAEYFAHFSDSQTIKGASWKKSGVMDERITTFKYWLVGSTGKSIHNPDDLQACYQELGCPTKDLVWDRLQLMDKKLFASNKPDFIKAVGNVIDFKPGTGKGRNS